MTTILYISRNHLFCLGVPLTAVAGVAANGRALIRAHYPIGPDAVMVGVLSLPNASTFHSTRIAIEHLNTLSPLRPLHRPSGCRDTLFIYLMATISHLGTAYSIYLVSLRAQINLLSRRLGCSPFTLQNHQLFI